MTDIKLKVERCDECPFHRTAHGDFWCCFDKDARRIGGTDFTPTWCPIRGKVVTIEGPEVKS